MAELELRLLGGFQARCSSGRSLELTTRKTRALLAYLALHAGQAQSREKLITLLWSDRAEKQGRDSLRQALTSLRKGLGAECVALLRVDSDAIAVEPAAVEVDASRFEQLLATGTPEELERAVELYRGDFLDGIGVRDPAFEDWMYAERERLHGRAVEALAKVLAHQAESGATNCAMATAARILQLDPLQEMAHRALIRLHAERGQRGLALRQYQACVDILKRELGIAPEPETVALYHSVRQAREPFIPSKIELARTAEKDHTDDLARAPPAIGPLAERRHLTIVFVDLVGSMALSTQLDPEQMRDLLEYYQKAVAKEAARFQGHVANVMGDEVLVYFGWPHAHEDDAERAIRASLAVRASVSALRGPEDQPLTVRIGIASGLVVVGEGQGQDGAIAGDTPNLASRLRALANPGQIVVTESTRRLLGDVFELAHLGTKSVEGISESVRIFAVTGERPVESRFDARSGAALLPMVGRDQELALLLERWAQAKAGEGQGVLLVGEAGIGKSRISRALLDAVAADTHIRIRYQCSPYHTDSALWPVIQQLCHAAALGPDDPLDAKLDKLEALLAQASGRDAAPLIADLIGLDGTARYGELGLTPQVQRARTLEALVGQLLGLAALRPVLVVLEDAHWIDPTTLELIEQGLDCIAEQRVLILLTSRPDQQPELAAHLHVTRLTLNRLARAGVEAIVARLGGDRLPLATIDTIVTRTDGVPLFVEELTKAVLETGETNIPASLQDSLMARLDRIPDVKEVAQIAACIGREFDYPLLAAVVDRTESSLQSALDRLAAAELVFRRGTPPKASYRFKHGLVQDAAYASLLHRRRHQLHARIGEVLEQRCPNRAEAEPEILAHHFSLSGDVAKGVRYMVQAGDWARRVFANDDALKHYQRARELAEASGVLAPERFVVLERLADLQGPAGRREEALGHYRTVLDALADAPAQARLHRKIAKLHWEAGAREEALSEFKAGLELLEGHQDEMELAYLYCEMGRLAFRKGDNEGAVDWARHALDRAQRVLAAASDDGLESAREAAVVVAEAYNTLGVAEARLSRRKDAIGYVERSLEVAERHGLLQTACRGYTNLSVLYCEVDPCRAIETCRKGLAVAQKIGDLGFQSHLYVNLGIACCTFTGRCAGEGVAAITKAIDLDREFGLIDHLPVSLVVLGQVYQCHGQPQTAIDLYSEALKLAKDLDEPQILFPCYDGLATVYLDMDDVERAEHYMEQSRAVCARAGLNREALLMLPFLS